ncbi:MCE family protein [Rhodococcus sp. AD45-ID]|jgi:phospholipid/cholesterol/gamma-HCH transport system substrate-binding protein|uniref:MCE family protein n=1 Tax=Rhodococcus globerulus TaxID=33008 RepID=A0ABU4BUY6_RHOGO|nr:MULTISPECIES: MCE family protein [Rhodococcus]KJF20514.1 virulence factor Mce family protein [Rhodococcus sp. AD45]MCE4269120.1 MCE family protein [Rhodococcus globerulus]MDV6268032.1 MCE family protein [Rhodococcus globerulus]MDV8070392.1 MCE family protein [Rhodococcus sp. IEGM 1366]NRI66552.1 MCE family protein [Rhodococcus sp. MS16]
MADITEAESGSKKRTLAIIAAALIGVLVVGGALWWVFTRAGTTTITAYFDKSIGIYDGSDVRVLGVKVGTVTSVEPQGDQVKVDLRVDRGIDIPVDANAAQVTPSVVADRYIQLTPVFTGGDKMASGSVIPIERTATPVEVDQLYASINDLASALGPEGANKDGALSKFVETGAANLDGNGAALGESITQLSDAARTLNDSSDNIAVTIKNLNTFVGALATNDQQVRQFNTQLSDLTGFLAGERDDLGAALNQLSLTLGDVAKFVADNRDQLATTAEGLIAPTQTLANNKEALANTLTLLPLAISNLVNSYDAESGVLASRLAFPDLQNPAEVLCKLMDLGKLVPGNPQFEELGRQMQPAIDQCVAVAAMTDAADQAKNMNLPFGILAGPEREMQVVPGTVPGVVSPRLSSGEGE